MTAFARQARRPSAIEAQARCATGIGPTDVDEHIAYYLVEATEQVAHGFGDALEQAYSHISRHLGTGSPRFAHQLNLPGLRFWQLTRYHYLVFYVERSDHIDVWRVLHDQRDIPAWMTLSDTDI